MSSFPSRFPTDEIKLTHETKPIEGLRFGANLLTISREHKPFKPTPEYYICIQLLLSLVERQKKFCLIMKKKILKKMRKREREKDVDEENGRNKTCHTLLSRLTKKFSIFETRSKCDVHAFISSITLLESTIANLFVDNNVRI